MPIRYQFRDSKTADTVAKALLFVTKFSKKQALVKFNEVAVGVIWGGPQKGYYVHAEYKLADMFRNRQELAKSRQSGIDHHTVFQVDPSVLGKILKGGNQDRNVSVEVYSNNLRISKIQVQVEYIEAKRIVTHTIPAEHKTLEDYNNMLIGGIEGKLCTYNTRSFVDNIHRLRHILDSFVRLNTTRVYFWSKRADNCNELTIHARTQGSNIRVTLSDLEDGQFAAMSTNCNDIDYDQADENGSDSFLPRRVDAGVNIDTKRLALFLGGLLAQRRSKVSFDIEHNKCLKVTLENEISQTEVFYQSMLLLHSLNN